MVMFSWSLLPIVKQQDVDLFGKTPERPQPIYWDPEMARQHNSHRLPLAPPHSDDFTSNHGLKASRLGSDVLVWSKSKGFRIISIAEE